MSMKKAQNGILPMVNSQQLVTSDSVTKQKAQQLPVGPIGAKAHMQEQPIGQAGLVFNDTDFKNYSGTHKFGKNGTLAAAPSHQSHSAKLDKQLKTEIKQQSMH